MLSAYFFLYLYDMLTFLRKLRRSFIDSSSAQKYILYAIGEIALVVIGILIALQINNWNESNKDLQKEQKILIQLKQEYESNLSQLEEKMSMRSNIIINSMEILDYIDRVSKPDVDSLTNYIGVVLLDPTFDPVQNDLFSSGNLRLIRNENLKSLLTNWSSDIITVQELEELWQRMVPDLFLPFLVNTGLNRDIMHNIWKDGKNDIWLMDKSVIERMSIGFTKNPPAHLSSEEIEQLEGLLANAITYNYAGNLQSETLRGRIVEIIELLNQEIK